jgi:hypothetical protein
MHPISFVPPPVSTASLEGAAEEDLTSLTLEMLILNQTEPPFSPEKVNLVSLTNQTHFLSPLTMFLSIIFISLLLFLNLFIINCVAIEICVFASNLYKCQNCHLSSNILNNFTCLHSSRKTTLANHSKIIYRLYQ